MANNKKVKITEQKKGKTLFSWTSKESVAHERGLAWHVAGGIIATLVIVYAVLYEQSWTMAAAIALLSAVVFLYSHEKPRELKAEITDLGVHFRGELYRYKQIKSFWFIIEDDYQALGFNVAERWLKTIIIQVKADDIDKIRKLLSQVLPEDTDRKESLIEYWGRKLKL